MNGVLKTISDTIFYNSSSVIAALHDHKNHKRAFYLSEGFGLDYFSPFLSPPTNNTMRTLLVSFLVLILFTITCSAKGFRTFMAKSTRRLLRRKRSSRIRDPLIAEEDREDVLQDDSSSSSSSSSSPTTSTSLREASRLLFQELWEDFNFFNFSSSEETPPPEEVFERDYKANVVHFCFLVHGHRGFSKDLSYLQNTMRQKAKTRKEQQQQEQEQLIDSTTESVVKEKEVERHDLVVHSSVCNEKKTDDGVEAGGDRLAKEVLSVIMNEMKQRRENAPADAAIAGDEYPPITISFLGNSLGGLYSRYAIAKIVEQCERDSTGQLILNNQFSLHLNIFCTTATPHLGVASHTFIKIPRTAELGVARAMGQTGRDLFRVNDLMRKMATLGNFINPMKMFRQRIAYANAYGTDFPVPVHTAAFLHEQSDYPHHFGDNKLEKVIAEEHSHLCVATIHTPPQHEHHTDDNFDVQEEVDELVVMSRSLDALGWKKVFVDPRKIVPKLSNPITRIGQASAKLGLNLGNSTTNSSASSMEVLSDSEHEVEEFCENQITQEGAIEYLKARGVTCSGEVSRAVAVPPRSNEHFHWPFGHNMIVAMSRNTFYTYLNKSGRPIVDAIAGELVNDIFEFSLQEESSNEQELSEQQQQPQDQPMN